jgi:hypothetical protein
VDACPGHGEGCPAEVSGKKKDFFLKTVIFQKVDTSTTCSVYI